MLDLRVINNTVWLAEPNYIRQAVAKLRTFAHCPTARELAEYSRERKAAAKASAQSADSTFAAVGVDLPEEKAEGAKSIRAVKGKVGVIGVYGPIQQRLTSELMKLGGTACDEVSLAFDAMMADRSIAAIVLHMDSPGGSSYGVEELSDKIYNARGEKPIYAHADSMACSAAYWLASAADMVICTPGGDVGSVGVYMVHVDESKALEEEGVSVTVVSAGKYKTELSNVAPLTDDAKSYLQGMVNDTHDTFIGALKRNRNTTAADVRDNYGQGRVLSAAQALAAGMTDRTMSFEQLLARLIGRSSDDGKKASVDQERRRQAQRKRQTELVAAYK
jgi:signal peptide peptidase SppA